MPGLVKTATTPTGRARLRQEASALGRARHPGVVAVAAYDDHDGATRLELVSVSGHTLADAPPTDPRAALRAIAALAATLADLHRVGLAHRRLGPDHVLLDATGRPVICGFAEASEHATDDDRSLDTTALVALIELFAVHARDAGRPTRPGRALRTLASDARAADPPLSPAVIARRSGRAAGRNRSTPAPRSTSSIAAVASPPPPPAATPGASSLPRRPSRPAVDAPPRRSALPQRAPTARARRAEPTRRAPHSPTAGTCTPKARRLVAVGSVPVIVAVAVVTLSGHAGDSSPTAADAAAPGTSTSTSTVRIPSPTPTSAPAATTRSPAGTPARVRLGERDYDAGQEGDQVVIADWTCSGVPAAALLRPSTGEVFLFSTLPDAGETVTSQLVTTVPDARQLLEPEANAACPALAVRDSAGATHQIGAR